MTKPSNNNPSGGGDQTKTDEDADEAPQDGGSSDGSSIRLGTNEEEIVRLKKEAPSLLLFQWYWLPILGNNRRMYT
jgi:hypothetical protein